MGLGSKPCPASTVFYFLGRPGSARTGWAGPNRAVAITLASGNARFAQ